MTDPGRRSGFREDVQGLRALAVGVVLLAHAGLQRFAGGFVGVDVFFVISGFLIIGLLFGEVQKSGRVSILGFYARRARRILPAATLVLLVVAAGSALLLPFVRGLEVLKDTVWAAFFGANLRFASVETDYFAADEPPSIVQHYWSLSVEEQFYLVIPLLIAAVAYLLHRRNAGGGAPALRGALALVLGAVVVGSFAWSLYATAANPTAAYFSTTARAWELAAGGLLAVLLWGRQIRASRWLADGLAGAGLLLVGWATLTYSAATRFPGWAALVPVVGALLLLAAGATTGGERSLLGRVLSCRPARLMGDWSFSLYLWHFPVFRFAAAEWGPLDRAQLVAALVVTFVLSAATYYGVEQPFRRGVRWRRPGWAIVLYPVSLSVVVAAALGGRAAIQHQLDALDANPPITLGDYGRGQLDTDPAVALVEASVRASEEGRAVPGNLAPALASVRDSIAPLGSCDYRTGTTQLCPLGDAEADRSIVLLGDSHARAWGPALTTIGQQRGYAVYQLVLSGCPANQATRADPESGGTWSACSDFNDWAVTQVEQLQPDLVVVANNAYLRGSYRREQLAGLSEELAQLTAAAPRVALLGNTPELSRAPGTCLSTRDVDLGDCLLTAGGDQQRLQRRFGAIARAAGAQYVDALDWFCVDARCPSVIGSTVPMRDTGHVTVPYAEQLAEPLAERLRLVAADRARAAG
ncbi:acyltransferase family protein [Nocardioides sp. GY 10113]|uniref:acyltransferase family protein n=1 Tax=Nocardioides sp. GY 10113 TaxID=2569761 RepID=UPI0014581219|nr:acyltransferase family protein [Nocardioides sp. GY 10113]